MTSEKNKPNQSPLSPAGVLRKRLVIELVADESLVPFQKEFLEELLVKLSEVTKMTPVFGPVVHSWAKDYRPGHYDGYEGFIVWAESGAQVYAWDAHRLATVDIYTCKDFSNDDVVQFVRKYFKSANLKFIEVAPLLPAPNNTLRTDGLFRVGKTEYGNGAFANRDIKSGTHVGSFDGAIYRAESESQLPAIALNTAIPIGSIYYRDSDSIGRNINHSCNANCYIKNTFEIHTTRDIAAGEELTLNYSLCCNSDWEVPGGVCLCGAENCHGAILPWRDLPTDEQARLLPYTSDWIVLEEMKRRGYVEKLQDDLRNGT